MVRYLLLLILSVAFPFSSVWACLPIPMHRIASAADVIVVGRYVDSDEPNVRGTIAVFDIERGGPFKTLDVVWPQFDRNDPAYDCRVEIPSSGSFEKYFLRKLEDGNFIMTGRAWEQDPLTEAEEEKRD